ncbi:STAS domain-containing protein [Actinokineospora sp. NPDC004072]
MDLQIKTIPNGRSATMSGELDLLTAPAALAELTTALAEASSVLDIDATGIAFCDSAGLHLLLELHKTATRSGKLVVLSGRSRAVNRVLEITDTAALFPESAT